MKINPILIKELKVRARSVHLPIFIMVFNAILAFIGIFMLMSSVDMLKMGGMADYGRMKEMFVSMGLFQFLMIILMTLTVSVTSFSGEKERGTLDLLLMTPVSTFELLNGKLLSAVITGFVFSFSALPVLMLGTVYGGMDITDVGVLYVMLFIVSFSVGSRGMVWSLVFDKTSVAMIFALVTEVVFILGPFLLLEFISAFLYNGYQYGMADIPVTAICISFQLLNPLSLIAGFYDWVMGSSLLMDSMTYFYGIWEDSSLYLFLEQYFVPGCIIGQIGFSAVVHLVNVKILKKGRNMI